MTDDHDAAGARNRRVPHDSTSTTPVTTPALRVARIDLAAAAANLAILGPGYVPDIGGGGYGHGAVELARVAARAGIETCVVRTDAEGLEIARELTATRIRVDRDPDSALSAAMYGLGPVATKLGLAPVMRVSARIMSVKRIASGEPVSYGYTWRAEQDTTLALLPLGYADGIHRSASNRGSLRLGGRLRPVVGRIAMDVLVLNVEDDAVVPGDEAVLFGDPRAGEPHANDWSKLVGIDPLEVTAGIGERVKRWWVPCER